VIRTSLSKDKLDANAAAYKSLAHVERAFRSMKTVDLNVRLVFDYSESRVRAHVFLCMLAYYVEWHMRARLKPMLFDDEYLDGEIATRPSPVAIPSTCFASVAVWHRVASHQVVLSVGSAPVADFRVQGARSADPIDG